MDNLVNLFTNEHGQFQNKFKIQVILLFLFVLVLFSKIWGSNDTGIFVILVISFSLYISNIYIKVNTVQNNDLDDDNKQTFSPSITLKITNQFFDKYMKNKLPTPHINIKNTTNAYV